MVFLQIPLKFTLSSPVCLSVSPYLIFVIFVTHFEAWKCCYTQKCINLRQKRVTQENTYLYLCLCLCIWENIYFRPGKRWTAIQRSLNGKLKISSKFIHFRFKICRFALFIKFLNRPFIIGSPSYLLWETLCKYFYLWCFDRSYTANVGRLFHVGDEDKEFLILVQGDRIEYHEPQIEMALN